MEETIDFLFLLYDKFIEDLETKKEYDEMTNDELIEQEYYIHALMNLFSEEIDFDKHSTDIINSLADKQTIIVFEAFKIQQERAIRKKFH